MTSGLDSLLAALRLEFIPALRKLGFKGSGKNFRRVHGETINAINIQGSTTATRFYVNLGLHFTFLPPAYGSEIPAHKLKEIDCEFRWRLHAKDNWKTDWIYGTSAEESAAIARKVLRAYLDFGEPAFHRFPTAEAVANLVPPEAVRSKKWNISPLTTTEIRLLLTLARIHRHLGNTVVAREIAQIGLSRLGGATGLRGDFESLAQLN
jgi:Domain of unknown function (DUF4304)